MDYTPSSRRLSDISHLFLSDVRKKQTGQTSGPARTPPGAFKGDVSVDLTPEEFADMMRSPSAKDPTFKPLRAVVAHHLGEAMADRVRDLAVTLGGDRPVGVVYADGGMVRVGFIDPNLTDAGSVEELVTEPLSPQRLREVLVELDQDVCEWLLVLPDHRAADTQQLMAQARDWTLLTPADHDGVVAAYRALKGLCGEARPSLTINVFDAACDADADKAARKLAGVCEQFLSVAPVIGRPVVAAPQAFEVGLLEAAVEDAGDSHWPILAALADGAAAAPRPVAVQPNEAKPFVQMPSPEVAFERPTAGTPVMRMTPTEPTDDAQAVIELPEADGLPAAILKAVIDDRGEWTATPVKAPGLPDAVVTVAADRRLTLLAVAKPGLADWRALLAAVKWMNENRALIAMAVPALNVDTIADAKLRVLVDHTELATAAAHPMLAGDAVSVAGYRKVRWAGRMGLLLEAA